jgi:FlaA1/EpsC-like NDP-sugar epimerase
MRVKDLIEIFSELYNKPVKVIGIKPGEKLLESLINKSQSVRVEKIGDYSHIKSIFNFNSEIDEDDMMDYNSKINPLTKEELKKYLIELKLL